MAQVTQPLCDLKFGSSIHCPTIHHPPVFSVFSGGFVRLSSKLFLLEALHDNLGRLCIAQCLCCLTPRVVMPQLHKQLCTLPVEVSFTHGPTHVLNMQSKKIILPWYVTEDQFPVYAGILCSFGRICIKHIVSFAIKKTTCDKSYTQVAHRLAVSSPS